MAIFEPVFKALNTAGVRYVVVGGVAVVLQGHARFTADVDLVVDLDKEQTTRTIQTLVAMNLRPRVPVDPNDFSDHVKREQWIRERGMEVFTMVDPANPLRIVDLFVTHPIPFEELYSRAEEVTLENTTVRVASIPDLIRMKTMVGRPQDRADIDQLEAILEQRSKGGKS